MGSKTSTQGSSGHAASLSAHDATSSSMSVAAGRISYVFGLRGPCSTTDTACSSSLVALHQARRSLQLQECQAALVIGVSILSVDASISCATAGMTSADGACHTFDSEANGYCRGEGCGAVVLKRLSDAVRDGNHIYAVIKGSAVLQDGASASLTAPNGLAQQDLLRSALKDADIAPSEVSYIEAHGTGTKLGDPIETEALASVYGSDRTEMNPLHISSIKANIGHLEAAAGMAGLLSVIQVLNRKQAPPNARLHTMNPSIASTVEGMHMVFPTETKSLAEGRLIAGVSSFGYSGTIAHVILEEAPDQCKSSTSLVAKPINNHSITIDTCEIADLNVWLFAGQGTLTLGVGRNLYDNEECFRQAMDTCDSILDGLLGVQMSHILYPDLCNDYSQTEAEEKIADTQYAQPLLVAFEYCICALLEAKGLRPDLLVGHSLGEYAAAVCASVMTINECLQLVTLRAKLVARDQLCEGRMIAVRLSESEALAVIAEAEASDFASLAAINGEKSVVISGSASAITNVSEYLSVKNIGYRELRVKHGFHSPVLSCIVDEYASILEKMHFNHPSLKIVSTILT